MLCRMLNTAKYFRSINYISRLYCNTSEGSIVKIGDKCYIPVPCPTPSPSQTSDGTTDKFDRITRGEPGKVRLGFISDDWCKFFHQKTGISGPYVFLVSVSSFLISKEYYVLEHEYYTLLSVVILLYVATTRVGPHIAKSIDKGIDEYERKWNLNREEQKKNFEGSITLENKLQQSMEGQLMLQDAKKENVALQLERAYRERILIVYKDIKKRLDYQISKALIEKKFIHRNLLQWVVDQVIASYTAEKEKQTIDTCLDHLTSLSTKYKGKL